MDKKILVVDDEEKILDVLKEYFEQRGFEVITADSGVRGIDLFKKEKPSIVLLDIQMPGINGISALKEMKQSDPYCKIVIISAVMDEKIYQECMQLGVLDYVVKPFDLAYLDAKIFGKFLQ